MTITKSRVRLLKNHSKNKLPLCFQNEPTIRTPTFAALNSKSEREPNTSMLSFLILLLLAQASCLVVTSQQPPKNIVILAGQSNMAGRGGVVNNTKTGITTWDGIVPPQCQPNPSIFRLSADLTWVLANEPLHKDIDYNKTNGIGPGMAFANAILTKEPGFGTVGLVPCAIGGTNISQWAKGGFLYDQLVGRSTVAMQSGGTIRAMLWYQGESDTEYKEDADDYKVNLENFFNNVRDDLNYPMLPIIQVSIKSMCTFIFASHTFNVVNNVLKR